MFEPIKIPKRLEAFLDQNDWMQFKSNEWLKEQIRGFGYEIDFEPFENLHKWMTSHDPKQVIIFEYDGVISPRNRFTMAHELAHVILHWTPENRFWLVTERQCDEFAWRLLISKEFAKYEWGRSWEDIQKFSESFWVSDICAEVVLDKYWIHRCDTFHLAPIFHAKPYFDDIFPPDAALQ